MKSESRKILSIFLIAFLIRGIVLLNVSTHQDAIIQPDSRMYISLARGLLQHGTLCYPDTPDRPDVERMPGYPLFLSSLLWLFQGSLLSAVAVQIILDSISCVLVFYLAERLWKGSGFLSGILATLNMGMITYAAFLLNDSLFLFVFLVILIVTMKFLQKPGWGKSILLGCLLGIAVLIRPVVTYIPLLLIPFFFIYLMLNLKCAFIESAGKSCLVGLVFILSLSPWLVRNEMAYGRFKLTSQSGEHLLLYIVPFVWQYSKGTPFIEGMKEANAILRNVEREGVDPAKIGPFEKNDLQVKLAMKYLKKEPLDAILKAWLSGMVKNLFSPAIIDFSYLLKIERPHFFYTEGRTVIERAWNFIMGIKGMFGWVVIGSLVLTFSARLMQLWGLFLLLRKKRCEGLFFIFIIFYFLLVSGPVGYAKYRLPFEPILIILLAVGLKDLYGRWIRRDKDRGSEAIAARISPQIINAQRGEPS